ncbi:MAG: metal-dependent phosphohydrolase [Propionicimonas sp.]
MADRAVVTGPLLRRWESVAPGQVDLGEELIARWSERHRRYHDLRHLAETLEALDLLHPASRVEEIALWFHDAVHTNSPGADERHSAVLAARLLPAIGITDSEIEEVVRLVLVTIDHRPPTGDLPGARVSDADLAILAAEPERYRASVADLRAEAPHLDDGAWLAAREASLAEFAARTPLFHSAPGNSRWEARARANLAAELAEYPQQ